MVNGLGSFSCGSGNEFIYINNLSVISDDTSNWKIGSHSKEIILSSFMSNVKHANRIDGSVYANTEKSKLVSVTDSSSSSSSSDSDDSLIDDESLMYDEDMKNHTMLNLESTPIKMNEHGAFVKQDHTLNRKNQGVILQPSGYGNPKPTKHKTPQKVQVIETTNKVSPNHKSGKSTNDLYTELL